MSAKKKLLEEAQFRVVPGDPYDTSESLFQASRTGTEINQNSQAKEKIALFRSLFKGREDVYAKRWENKKTGKSGYQPVCRNEWVKGVCGKPKISCGDCTQRSFEPVTDAVIY